MPTISKPNPVHFGPSNPCRIPSCPLNEAAIMHGKGYTNITERRQVVFIGSNIWRFQPTRFIWEANQAHEEALAGIKKGVDVKVNWGVAAEMATLVQRYCELHVA